VTGTRDRGQGRVLGGSRRRSLWDWVDEGKDENSVGEAQKQKPSLLGKERPEYPEQSMQDRRWRRWKGRGADSQGLAGCSEVWSSSGWCGAFVQRTDRI
jgi:hypothetical protein